MTNTTPIIGRLAVITIGSTAVGFGTGITASIPSDLIKDYVQGSQKPAILEQGNQSFKITVNKLFIDGTYATQVLGGTKVTVIVYPKSTTNTGDPKFTFSNVIFNTWNLKMDQKGVEGEDIAGEGDNCTVGTV